MTTTVQIGGNDTASINRALLQLQSQIRALTVVAGKEPLVMTGARGRIGPQGPKGEDGEPIGEINGGGAVHDAWAFEIDCGGI